jgi:hypothetical protein
MNLLPLKGLVLEREHRHKLQLTKNKYWSVKNACFKKSLQSFLYKYLYIRTFQRKKGPLFYVSVKFCMHEITAVRATNF